MEIDSAVKAAGWGSGKRGEVPNVFSAGAKREKERKEGRKKLRFEGCKKEEKG